MTPVLPQSIGWYGKLPTRGDFVGRGLPRAWLRGWDGWLQRSLAAAAQQIGAPALRERLQAMPPWQVLVLPQRAADVTWCGVVVASADRVGRVFPLLLAEAYEPRALGSVDLGELRARGRVMAQWLAAAQSQLVPKELESAPEALAAAPLRSPGPDDTRPGADVEGLCQSEPGAAAFWWPVNAAKADTLPLAESWPPSEGLMLQMLGFDKLGPNGG
jgi:type VI secretion system protein ImpM